MSALAPNAEAVVGRQRHPKCHLGRAVSAEQRVYILHSQECLDSGRDLRACPFSLALDRGIDRGLWESYEDKPVLLAVLTGPGLIPTKALS